MFRRSLSVLRQGARTLVRVRISQHTLKCRHVIPAANHVTPVRYLRDMDVTGIGRKTPSPDEVTEEFFDVVAKFIEKEINNDSLKLEMKFIEDLGLDSLDVVELIMLFEDHFEITITDEEAEKVESLQDALDILFVKIEPEA